MSSENANYILVLDDDKNFRDLVGALLRSKGYEVMLARSAKEASAFLEAKRPGLAIVDYRLPETDGMSWITKVRENDATLPIVMVTGNWCDQKTFNWLRNILKVSLVLQKPIVPELFLHSLEGIAPPPPEVHTPSAVADTSGHDSIKAITETPDAEFTIEALTELLEAGELDEEEA
ncbi:MAG: response regulator, partial [Leptolyngbya sp.]|nr:response regulator [Candidatus Melainabacteria bacterium]